MNKSQLFKLLAQCTTQDSYFLCQQLKKASEHHLEKVTQKIQQSVGQVSARYNKIPKRSYDTELPICQQRDTILELIQNHQVVIIAGETGSGKTTQLPKMCLDLGLGARGLIGHTQPRRIAARSVADRLAEELNISLGQQVGYKIRFNDKTKNETLIKVMTDGILLSEAHHDPYLNQYEVLIIDEAHERSLNIDFILGYLKRLLPKRPDLKVIITSATIDPEKFSNFFDDAPILQVSGRTYPVDILYRPLRDEEDDKSLGEGIIDAVEECFQHGPGDVLCFLSGEREIREVNALLTKHAWQHVEILPLYSRLSQQQQHRIFEGHTGFRIILATNVAETSLTVPGIRYVIDAGKARLSRYSYRSQVQRLPIEAISQASAKQRAGRCGRTMPGICIRLYAEEDFEKRDEFTQPEILRTNLASVILQMLALRLGDINKFPFIQPPDQRYVRDGLRILEQIRAIDCEYKITALGKQLARLPIDPRLGAMLMAGSKYAVLNEMLIIVSFLSVADPREVPHDFKEKSQQSHARFFHKDSDFLTVLNLWEYIREQQENLSKNKFKRLCQQEFLSLLRIKDWQEIFHQLLATLKEMRLQINQIPGDSVAIHKSLLVGLVTNVAILNEDGDYTGTKAKHIFVFPGSSLKKSKPKWLVAFEIFETSRVFARMVAKIDVRWVEQVADHLLKRNYSDPYWDEDREQVMVHERATFYGLPIYNGRKKIYAHINRSESRQIFIRSALVEGLIKSPPKFLRDNMLLIEDVVELEHKSRRRDILIHPDELFEFYDRKLPDEIVDSSSLTKWLKQSDSQQLIFERQQLMNHEAENINEYLFPAQIINNKISLPASYKFEPNHEDDGVSVTIQSDQLTQLDKHVFEWIVPGLIEEKVIALIKTLPKTLRKNFVPAPNFAEAALNRISYCDGSLLEALGNALTKMTGVPIPNSAWQPAQIPRHLHISFVLVDNKKQVITKTRDWQQLIDTTKQKVEEVFAAAPQSQVQESNLTQWDFDDLPEYIEIEQDGIHVIAYPRLIDRQDHVEIKNFTNLQEAQQHHRQGVRRLISLVEQKRCKYLAKNIPQAQKLSMMYARYGNEQALRQELTLASIEHTFLTGPLPLTLEQFKKIIQSHQEQWIANFNQLSKTYLQSLMLAKKVNQEITAPNPPKQLQSLYTDMTQQLGHLIYRECLLDAPLQYIKRYPVYLQAMLTRLDKARHNIAKDQQAYKQLAVFWKCYLDNYKDQQLRILDSFWQFRWMIEEFRLNLFAQQFKTLGSISAKRLNTAWQTVLKEKELL